MTTGTNMIGAMLFAVASAVAMAHYYDGGVRLVPTPEIAELEAHCLKTSDLPHHVGSSCSEQLGRRFATAPIWEGAVLYYNDFGRLGIHRSVLSDRGNNLRYAPADLLPPDLPVWSDIFDGEVERRIDVAARVFQDPVCAALDDSGGGGGIRVELNEHCEARELFKYAAYLDACMTGLDRVRHLHAPVTPYGASRYDGAQEAPGIAEAGLMALSLAESSLLSMWVADQCGAMPSRMFDRDLRLIDEPDELKDHRELANALKPVHDTAMSIAARAGDPWAVQAFYVKGKGLIHDVEYWRSLREFDPLLFHRWMAEIGPALGLEPQDQAVHAVKAFMIGRGTSPGLKLDDSFFPYHILQAVDPSWLDGSALPDASDIEESLVYPWNTARGEMLLQMNRSKTPGTLAAGNQDAR